MTKIKKSKLTWLEFSTACDLLQGCICKRHLWRKVEAGEVRSQMPRGYVNSRLTPKRAVVAEVDVLELRERRFDRSKYISPADAAERIGVTQTQIRRMIKRGEVRVREPKANEKDGKPNLQYMVYWPDIEKLYTKREKVEEHEGFDIFDNTSETSSSIRSIRDLFL